MKNIKKNKKIFIYLISFCFILSALFNVTFKTGDVKYNITGKNEVFAACDNPPCNDVSVEDETRTQTDGSKGKEAVTIESDFGYNIFLYPFSWLLQLIGFFVVWVVSIVNWTLSPDFMTIFKNDGIRQGWVTVRDFLNIFFIFFLLFSAFATIFQVSRYHIKSTWVMIVVMALLVNFSWPITRVMIDMSNVTMTYILSGKSVTDGGKEGNNLMASFGENTDFVRLMVGEDFVKEDGGKFKIDGKKNGIGLALLTGIVMGFIFLVTMSAIAFLLMIRVIILVVLLIFAPVGFVLAAFPSTKSQSSAWWSALIKQLIIGPVLLFLLLISAVVLKEFGSGDSKAFLDSAKAAADGNSGIETMMKFIVSIILIWSGMLAASKIGGEGSSMVVGKAGAAVRGVGNRMKRGGIAGGKFVGRETAQRTNTGIHKATRAVQRKVTGNENAQGLNIAAVGKTTKDRFKGAAKAKENARNDLAAEARANYMEVGSELNDAGGIKGFISKRTVGYGADKNSQTKHQNQKYVDKKKNISESGMDSESAVKDVKKAKNEGELRALLEHGMKDDNFGGDRNAYSDLIAIVNKVVTSEKGREKYIKKINKEYDKKGNDDLTFKTEVRMEAAKSASGGIGKTADQVARDKFSKYDGEQMAKSSMFKALNKNNTDADFKEGVRELGNTFNSKSAEFQAKVLDKMTVAQKNEITQSNMHI